MQLEQLNEPLQTVSLITKLSLQIGIAIGVVITIIYCGLIDYYPSGLTIGDTFFFITSSLGFTTIYTVTVLAFFCSGIFISPMLRWLQKLIVFIAVASGKKKTNDPWLNFPLLGIDMVGHCLIGLLIVLGILGSYGKDFDQAFSLTMVVLSMGIFYGFWHTKPKEIDTKEKERKAKLGLAFIIAIIPILLIEKKANIINHSMRIIGVRVESTTIQLPDKHAEFLSIHDIEADVTTKSGRSIYKDTTLLFNGIGEYSVVLIKGLKLYIPRKDLIIGTLEKEKTINNSA